MKEDIKNVQSLKIDLDGKQVVFNREGDTFVYNEVFYDETETGSFSSTSKTVVSENRFQEFDDSCILTYTKEYKQKLEDDYEAKLKENLEKESDVINIKKRTRNPKQIFKKLLEYQQKLSNTDDVEAITVYSNMIKLLEWVLKIK